MHISAESLLAILLIGAIAGWLAGQIVQGTGFGLLGDIIIGIVGPSSPVGCFPNSAFILVLGLLQRSSMSPGTRESGVWRRRDLRPTRGSRRRVAGPSY